MRFRLHALSALLLAAAATACSAPSNAQQPAAWTALEQSPDAVLAHQRLPGNARAQAKRRGAIRTVPHLFVYHRDGTPAFHMDGLRPGFERQLDLLIDAFRIDRSMVELDTLLANARNADGVAPLAGDLEPGRIVLVLYTRDGCSDCETVRDRLETWLDGRPDLEPNRLLIRMP